MDGWIISVFITVIGFVAHAAYIKGAFGTKLTDHDEEIKNLKKTVRYADTCNARHEEIDRRFARAESMLNGKIK